MGKVLRPGEKAPRSGKYEIRGPRGASAGKELSSTRGKPLPPTPKAGHGITIIELKIGQTYHCLTGQIFKYGEYVGKRVQKSAVNRATFQCICTKCIYKLPFFIRLPTDF